MSPSATSIRHMLYEQKGGYLLVPVLIMVALSILALGMPIIELSLSPDHLRGLMAIAPNDPSVAQLLLVAIAGSCITVVSVVYSVLLIALTFASIQFSPRILTIFLKDRVSQSTMGIFIGTFAYCMVLLPSIHVGQGAAMPSRSVSIAMLLAATCIFYLIYFIHHIALGIQANYIVDRIATETESVLRSQYGHPLKGFPKEEEPLLEPIDGLPVKADRTGYVQYIEEERLLKLAEQSQTSLFIHRGIGQFLPAGVPCISISPANRATEALRWQCLSCFHVGPLRSMEDDVQFGMLQMVDIALKAISPAVNDPSTAISCIDHLSAILIVAATLEPPTNRIFDDQGTVRILRRQPSFPRLLEIAYNQISPYGKGDMAVSLRLMRALHDISGVTNYPPYLLAIRQQAQRVAKACAACFPQEDCAELFERLAVIERRRRDN